MILDRLGQLIDRFEEQTDVRLFVFVFRWHFAQVQDVQHILQLDQSGGIGDGQIEVVEAAIPFLLFRAVAFYTILV